MPGSGADTRIAYIAESTFNTTPATPTFKVMRVTSGGLRTAKTTVVSEELRQDQNVADELQVAQDVSGSMPFEMSYASFDDMIEAVLGGTWSSDVLKNGITNRSFTFEETIELGATDSFRRFTGCVINEMSLSIQARQKITGSVGIMGVSEALATAIVTGATYTAANTNQIMTSGVSVGSVSVGGLSGLKIRMAEIAINRNKRRLDDITSINSFGFNNGQCDVTGRIEVYFESNAAYQAVLDHGTAAISLTIGQDDDEKYTIAIPRARWLDGSAVVGGRNDDIMVSMPFRGTYDDSETASIKITRAVA